MIRILVSYSYFVNILDLQNKLFDNKRENIIESAEKNGENYGQNHHESRKPDSFLSCRPVNVAKLLPCFLNECLNAPEHCLNKISKKPEKSNH